MSRWYHWIVIFQRRLRQNRCYEWRELPCDDYNLFCPKWKSWTWLTHGFNKTVSHAIQRIRWTVYFTFDHDFNQIQNLLNTPLVTKSSTVLWVEVLLSIIFFPTDFHTRFHLRNFLYTKICFREFCKISWSKGLPSTILQGPVSEIPLVRFPSLVEWIWEVFCIH